MKEQTLVEYLKEHKFESVFVASVPKHDSKRDTVIDIVKDTLGVVATPGIMTLDESRSKLLNPYYKITNMAGKSDRNLLFTTDLTIGITDDGYPSVLRVGLKFGNEVGIKFMEF